MLRLSSFKTWVAGVSLALVTALGAVSCGSSDGDLVSACESWCAAQAKPACKNSLPAEMCKAGCTAAPMVLGGQCLAENTAAIECASDLEWTCMGDIAVPTLTGCVNESLAFVKCQQEAPCRGYCKAAVAAGCGGASEDACFQACEAELQKQGSCDNDLGQVRLCEGQQKLACVNGKPMTPLCVKEKASYVDCLSFDDPCSGFCYLADDAGCPGTSKADCIMACQTQLSAKPNCQTSYEAYARCAGEKGVTCSGGMATTPACTTEQQAFTTCVMMP